MPPGTSNRLFSDLLRHVLPRKLIHHSRISSNLAVRKTTWHSAEGRTMSEFVGIFDRIAGQF